MTQHINNIALSYRNSYDYYHKDRVQQKLSDTKKSAKTHAIVQGCLALGGLMLGRYALDKNNPIAFLVCLAVVRGAVEEHTKALSQYLTARRKSSNLDTI